MAEPKSIIAGDTVKWTTTLAAYPASAGWSLSYRLINAAARYDISGAMVVASGDSFNVTIPAATTAGYPPGDYTLHAVVTKASERYTVGQYALTVTPDLAGATGIGIETRTTAQQIVEALQAAWLEAATNRAFTGEYEIAGRRMKFDSKSDWIKSLDYWKREAVKEKRQARIAAGLGGGTKVYTRF